MGSSTSIEHQGFAHANPLIGIAIVDGLVSPGGLPESGSRCPVRPSSGRILLVLVAKEVPFVLWP